MMNKILNIILLTILTIVASCGSHNGKKLEKTNTELDNSMTFKEKIHRIEKQVVDLTSPSSLFNSKIFIEIYEHPKAYMEDAILLLSDTCITEQQKAIAVYSMQRLELNDYKIFLNETALLYSEKVINELIMRIVISSGFGKDYIVVKNYKDKEIEKILKEIQENDFNSREFNSLINNIIKGKTWKELQSYLKNSGI